MCGQMQINREGTSLYNRADAIAVWKDLNVMAFTAIMYVWYKMAIIAVELKLLKWLNWLKWMDGLEWLDWFD